MSSEELLQENARLRERVAALEAAQRRSGAGSWELGADGRFEWSDSMYDLVGHQPLNEIPSPDLFARSIHPDDQARVREAFEANWSGTTTRNFDYRLRMADGSLRHLRTNAELRHRTDGVPYVAGTTHDVTDLHEALAELRVRNLSIESALNAVAIASLDGRITYVNPALLRLWELESADAVVGRQVSEFWEDETELAATTTALRSNRAWTGEMRARTTTGKVLQLQVSASVVLDESRNGIAILGSFQDVTERHASEAALRASLAEKDALLKEVHHRVKNNLQIVTSLLRLEASRRANPETKAVLGDMQHRLVSMAMVHELLYRSGNVAQVELSAYLESVTRHLFGSLAPPGRRVALHTALEPARVEVDQAVPCGLLVNELLSNSLKHGFADEMSGEVRVTLAWQHASSLQLAVRDSGVGLPDAVRRRQFDSLGLQLVSDLARQLRGTLDVGSGPGASFTLTFTPRRSAPVSSSPTGSPR